MNNNADHDNKSEDDIDDSMFKTSLTHSYFDDMGKQNQPNADKL